MILLCSQEYRIEDLVVFLYTPLLLRQQRRIPLLNSLGLEPCCGSGSACGQNLSKREKSRSFNKTGCIGRSRIQFEPSPKKKSPKVLKFLLKPLVHLFRNHFNTHVPVINVSCTVLPEIFLIIRFYYLVYVLNRFVKLCIFKALAN